MTATQPYPTLAPTGRQVSLLEAGLWALAVNVLVYVLLPLFGLTGLLLADVPAPAEEPELRFTFADASEAGEEESPAAVDNQGSEPGSPEIAPPLPDPEAAASLDRPQQAIPPSLPMPATMPLPGDAVSDNPAGPVEEPVESETPDPPSDGIEDGVEDGVDTPSEQPFTDDPVTDTELTEQEVNDDAPPDGASTEQVEEFAVADDGRFGRLEQPTPSAPAPRIGRPGGASLDERISAFGRAVERFRAQTPTAPHEPRNVFEPDWSNLPPTGQILGNMTFESGDFDWTDYRRQIYWIIWRAWHNRLLARADDFEKWAQQTSTPILDHVNGVRFTIESNGEIGGIVLEMDSGSVPFDLSSIEGLDESVLPPLPAGFPRDRETVHVQFLGYGPIGSMRRGLQDYKRRGWF